MQGWLFLVIPFFLATQVVGDIVYDGVECQGVINFPLVDNSTYSVEALKFSNVPAPPFLAESIHRALRKTMCLEIHAPGAVDDPIPCADACQELNAMFGGPITSVFSNYWTALNLIPTVAECNAYPTTNCQQGGEPNYYNSDEAECPWNYYQITRSDYKLDGTNPYAVPETDCTIKCPDRLLSQGSWEFAITLVFVFSWVGSFLSLVVLVCYFIYKRTQHLVILFTLSCFVSSFAVAVFLSFGGPEKLVCMSRTIWDEKSPSCVTQAAFTVWGFLSAVCWVVCQTLDVHAKVVMECRNAKMAQLRLWYPAIGLVVPIVAVLVLAISGHLGFDGRSPFDVCFIRKTGDSSYLYIFYIGPQVLACALCLGMMIAVVVKITKVMNSWGNSSDGRISTSSSALGRQSHVARVSQSRQSKSVKTESAASRALRYNMRPLLFISLCLVICGMNVVLVFYYVLTDDHVYDGATDYAKCLFQASKTGINDEYAREQCGTNYPDRHPTVVHAGITAGLACLAFVPFLVYGYSLPPTRAVLSWLLSKTFTDSDEKRTSEYDDSGSIITISRPNGRSRPQSVSSGIISKGRASMEMADLHTPPSPTTPRDCMTPSTGRDSTLTSHSSSVNLRAANAETKEEGMLVRVNSMPASVEADAKRRAQKVLELPRPASSPSVTDAQADQEETKDAVSDVDQLSSFEHMSTGDLSPTYTTGPHFDL